MTTEELLMPRYEVIAVYPYCPYNIGDLVRLSDLGTSFHCTTTQEYSSFHEATFPSENYFSLDQINVFPNLFRLLHWAEKRLLDDLMSVKYVKITIYTGYWVVGDIVKVTDYEINTKEKKLIEYVLGGTQNSTPDKCIPSTEEEYIAFKKSNK